MTKTEKANIAFLVIFSFLTLFFVIFCGDVFLSMFAFVLYPVLLVKTTRQYQDNIETRRAAEILSFRVI